MEQYQEYQQRLAALDEAVARARLDPAVVVARAAGLLAGRVGSRVDDAHAYLLRRASQEGRAAEVVAAEILAALQGRTATGSRRLDAAVDQALRPAYRSAAPGRRQSLRPTEAVPAQGSSDDWVRTVQQVLDALPDSFTVLLPVASGRGVGAGAGAASASAADGAGEIVDYVVAAASPSMTDLSGRRGTQIVGRRISEVYPTVVDGPVWHAWREVLADGQARDVGPFPYVAANERAPADVMITARIRPLGPGLINSWVRHDEQTRLAERIARTERLGHLGWGEADLVTGEIVWSDEVYRIYERDPALGPLTGEEQDALTLPEDEPIRRQATEGFGHGDTVDVTTRVRIGGRIKHLRSIVDAERDAQGRPVKVYGIVQDVTAQETNRAQLAEVEQMLREHQRSLAAEHQLAAQLQHIVLPVPAEPFDLPGLRVAVRYLPAEEASRVGGDWFHAAEADDGSIVLAVGDVAGHGMPAATVMAQLRHMLAGLTVTTTSDPARLLWHLNRLLYADGITASVVIARYDPGSRMITWAQGGHPAPLHTRAGTTVSLARPGGLLLGVVRTATYDTATLTLDPGDLILFYTDGLIEHRSKAPADGVAPVVAALNRISTSGSSRPLADLLDQLRRANPNDDTCILAVRHQLLPPPARSGVTGGVDG